MIYPVIIEMTNDRLINMGEHIHIKSRFINRVEACHHHQVIMTSYCLSWFARIAPSAVRSVLQARAGGIAVLVMDPVYGPLVVMLTMIFIKFAVCVREPRRGVRRVWVRECALPRSWSKTLADFLQLVRLLNDIKCARARACWHTRCTPHFV